MAIVTLVRLIPIDDEMTSVYYRIDSGDISLMNCPDNKCNNLSTLSSYMQGRLECRDLENQSFTL